MKYSIIKLGQILCHKLEECLRWSVYRCDLCLQPCQHFTLLCDTCYRDLIKFNVKRYQGDLLNHPKVNKHLGKVTFDQLISFAPYQWPYDHWISQLKYLHRFEVGELLGKAFAHHLLEMGSCTNLPKVCIPVPLHGKRLKARQYNQASLIAKGFTKVIGGQCHSKMVKRIINTEQQVGQSGANRRKNLVGAFAVVPGAKFPEHVALVDDVITTGSTVNEISQLLLQHGVKKITVLTICLVIQS